ncbi:hypothetical protein DACRYDRAFT_21041 [Dacryopinax primogenitus]|uniref:Structure-specific endonuclease subunit SLX1 C-terminal domain-containing protein n=1 Tax=Dacryopinax primogenitus (strain DJM 731) TaxID=1858805 RepID=M5GBK4_DACPD|nr:uncharacterized protein DACRYDRAFT_21041 [Dacryopinax primogenitus]EJU03442.1 hypothetical protein DACRYDRAFT_21041 [Dacryopinax primogenitus]
MLAHAPYRTWPLHVKLFHEDGLKAWRASEIYFQGEPPLPTMCRIELELEGVDGKAGGGTGRAGGIEVNDEAFAGAHVRKLRRILGTSKLHTCSICEQALLPSLPALTTALCPLGSCSATSHISCLAGDFLKQKPTDTMMPRTGTCKLCGHTLLWGDIVRGCYRRQKGGLPTTAEDNEEQEEDEDEDDEDEDGLDVQEGPLALAKSIIQSPARSLPTRKGPPAFSVSKPGLSAMHASKPRGSKNEHNRHIPSPKNAREMYLDIDDISSLSASESAPKTARVSAKRRASLHKVSTANGRRRLSIPPRSLSLSKPQASIAAKTRPNRPKPAPKRPATQVSHASGEEFDLDNISSCSDD